MSRTPTLAELVEETQRAAVAGVYTGLMATVVRYDPALQQADVQVLTMEAHENEVGERVPEALPVLVNCPVQFPTYGGLVIIGPVAVGDTGWVKFSRHSLDKLLASDGGRVLDPDMDHRFSLSDAVFEPGVRPFGRPRDTNPGAAICIGTDGGSFQGAGLGETIKSYLDDLKSYVDGHMHIASGSLTSAPSSGLDPSPPFLPIPAPGPAVPTTASSTVKVTP